MIHRVPKSRPSRPHKSRSSDCIPTHLKSQNTQDPSQVALVTRPLSVKRQALTYLSQLTAQHNTVTPLKAAPSQKNLLPNIF